MPHTVTINVSTRSTQDSGATVEDVISQTSTSVVASKEAVSATVPAAKAGTLTTRTDDDTGELTLGSGHGITTGAVIDVFWTGGSRRGMTVGTVAALVVPIDGGSGDVLPAEDAAITCMVPTEVSFVVDGDEVTVLSLYSPRKGFIVFEDDLGAEIAAAVYEFESAGGKVPFSPAGGTNGLAGETTGVVKFSHDDSSNSRVMKAIAYFNEE